LKKLLGNIALFFISILVMAALFEVACRTVVNTGLQYDLEMWKYAVGLKRIAADPAVGHEHVPGSAARLMRSDVNINSGGLRNREVTLEKPAGTARIMMLGDSIVFGWGVDQDKTMSVDLEKDLSAGGFGLAEVINTGVGNYNTAMEVAYFLKSGAAYHPDTVVLNYFINDAEPTPTYQPVPWYARRFYAYAVSGGAWDIFKRSLLGGPEWHKYYADLYRDGQPGWMAAQDNIRRLAAYCRENGIRLVMTNIPELHQLSPYPFVDVNAKLAAIAAAEGIEYVDLLPAVTGEAPDSLWVTAPDPHPNAKAHALMARRLADYFLVNRQPSGEAVETPP
jgi:lysophospholipase L1-like esterase